MVAMATPSPTRLAPMAHPATPGPPAVPGTQAAVAVARASTSSRAGLPLRIGGLVGVRTV